MTSATSPGRPAATIKIAGYPLHATLTPERILEAVERQATSLENPGFCVACGTEAEGCEPDAQRYACDACGQNAVFGAEELLIRTT